MFMLTPLFAIPIPLTQLTPNCHSHNCAIVLHPPVQWPLEESKPSTKKKKKSTAGKKSVIVGGISLCELIRYLHLQ